MDRPKRGKRMSLAWYQSTLDELYRAYIREFGSCDPSRHDRPLHRGPFMQVWTRVRPQWLASYPFADKAGRDRGPAFRRSDGEYILHEIDWSLRQLIPRDFHKLIIDVPLWLAGKHLSQTGKKCED